MSQQTLDIPRQQTTTPIQLCPHCGSRLRKWLVPDGASWSEEYFLVCFNDDCAYYKDGWVWMREQYSQSASYRYMINPRHGGASPLPVWSDTAMRNLIVDDGKGD
ncbi:MAG: ogr/Delta-like zinc finger family protein [Isosphaeraceae bacterium]